MILQIKTEKELIEMVEALQKEVGQLKAMVKKPAAEPAFSDSDFLAMRDKHVTIDFVNRLYKKGGK